MMKRNLILTLGFLPLLAVNLQAMESQEKFVSVESARGQFVFLKNEVMRVSNNIINALKRKDRVTADKEQKELDTIVTNADRMKERLRMSSAAIRTKAVMDVVNSLGQEIANAKDMIEEARSGRRIGEGGEGEYTGGQYTMDFDGAMKIASEIKQQLAAVSAAGNKSLNPDQKRQLNSAAGINLF